MADAMRFCAPRGNLSALHRNGVEMQGDAAFGVRSGLTSPTRQHKSGHTFARSSESRSGSREQVTPPARLLEGAGGGVTR